MQMSCWVGLSVSPEQQVARDDGPRYWSDAYPEGKRGASPVRLAGGFYSSIAFPGFFLSYTSLSPSQIASPCWQTSSLAISLLKGISVSKADACTSARTIFLSQHCRKAEKMVAEEWIQQLICFFFSSVCL